MALQREPTMQDQRQMSPIEGAPPTSYDPVMLERRSSWPTVVGTISIVLGALGILMYGCCGMLGAVLGPMMIGMAPPGEIDEVTKAQMDALRQYMPYTLVLGVAATALAVLLLISGIGLVRRRSWCVKSHVTWAIARLVFAIPHSAVSYVMNKQMFESMQQASSTSGAPMPPGLATIMASAGIIGVVIGLVWAALWPGFVLFWFNRATIREEVAMWDAEARARI